MAIQGLMKSLGCTSNELAIIKSNGRWQEAELLMAVMSVLMSFFSFILLKISLAGRFTCCALLNPIVRLFLWGAFSLFLPLMSYMFSESKKSLAAGQPLPPRAYLILLWMILVELLRKKVAVILYVLSSSTASPTEGLQGQQPWEVLDEAVRLGLIGFFVYSYRIEPLSRKVLLIVLWTLALLKTIHKSASLGLARKSMSIGKSAKVVAAYMDVVVARDRDAYWDSYGDGEQWLRRCSFVVMGEEKLGITEGPKGYQCAPPDADYSGVVTVGHVWSLAAEEGQVLCDGELVHGLKPKYTCLSFALYKLLRRRLESRRPLAEADCRAMRDLVLDGFHTGGDAETAFKVVQLELSFLSDYYYSYIPVALSDPWMFIANSLVVFAIIAIVVLVVTLVALTTSNLQNLLGTTIADMKKIVLSFIGMAQCLSEQLYDAIAALFNLLDLWIAVMLLFTLMYMESSEFISHIFSDWFMVSLLCNVVELHGRRRSQSRFLRSILKTVIFVKKKSSCRCGADQFNQFDVVSIAPEIRWVPQRVSKMLGHRLHGVRPAAVTKEVKKAVMESLNRVHGPPDRRRGSSWRARFAWACKRESATEVILIWHIATIFFDKSCCSSASPDHRKVAVSLSKYCTYLVAFEPELLPDDPEGTAKVYEEVKKKLKTEALKEEKWYSIARGDRRGKLLEKMEAMQGTEDPAAAGAELWRQLKAMETEESPEAAWRAVAELWADLLVAVAPSTENVEAHARALLNEIEFITVVWAMVTHAGIGAADWQTLLCGNP